MSCPMRKKPKLLEGTLRADLNNDEVVSWIKSSWTNLKDIGYAKKCDMEILFHPYPVYIINEFIDNPELLKSVKEELKNVCFHQKSNDLYQFKQSSDVRNLQNFTYIPQLYDVIRNEGREWVNKVLGKVALEKNISATFSSYKYHDRLLCHDDKCEDRYIAFILYLVEDWSEEDGGALQLFNSDSNGYPQEIVKTIIPRFNTMILFEVTDKSFHQVSEVLSETKERLSLNGWFHSSGKKLNKTNCKVLEMQKNFGNDKEYNLEEYFLFTYFEEMNKLDIKGMFLNDSEIQLEEFLVPKFWDEIEKDLKNDQLKWTVKGPANIRKYEVLETSSLPPSLQTLKYIFESKCWFRYLKSITALDFVPSETSDMKIWDCGQLPYCNFEIQKWTHSCYTLIHDMDTEFHYKTLDVILRIPCGEFDNNDSDQNDDAIEPGHIYYIDGESRDEECLLHIGYKKNSLALVFRDTKTLRFTKYLDSKAEPFYQIFCTYRPWEPPTDQPHLRHCEESSDSEHSSDSDNLDEDEYSQDKCV